MEIWYENGAGAGAGECKSQEACMSQADSYILMGYTPQPPPPPHSQDIPCLETEAAFGMLLTSIPIHTCNHCSIHRTATLCSYACLHLPHTFFLYPKESKVKENMENTMTV